MTDALELMARQLERQEEDEGGLPLPRDLIRFILKWTDIFHRKYFRRKALPGFAQLFQVSLDSFHANIANYRRPILRVYKQPVQFVEGTYPRPRKIFTPIGVAKRFYGPGF